MSSEIIDQRPVEGLEQAWGMAVEAAVCPHCDWSYLLPQGSPAQRCPHCFEADLEPLAEESGEGMAYTRPPELLLPFSLPAGRLGEEIARFAQGIPFAPADLNPGALQGRLRRVFLPTWMVDAGVSASWQAEAGFNYEVVSHQDHYDEGRGGWASRQTKEGRIRWEPRLGTLKRSYTNILAPALEEQAHMRRALGDYDLGPARAYAAAEAGDALVRLPDRAPQDVWTAAAPGVQAAASEECRRAAGADHMRGFAWQPEFHDQNWTLLLSPAYTSYYLDDEGKPQPVLVNGQTGQLSGKRLASMKRAQRASLYILIAAVVIFLLSLAATAAGALLPPLLPVGAVGLALALFVGLGAVIPVGMTWGFNWGQGSASP